MLDVYPSPPGCGLTRRPSHCTALVPAVLPQRWEAQLFISSEHPHLADCTAQTLVCTISHLKLLFTGPLWWCFPAARFTWPATPCSAPRKQPGLANDRLWGQRRAAGRQLFGAHLRPDWQRRRRAALQRRPPLPLLMPCSRSWMKSWMTTAALLSVW